MTSPTPPSSARTTEVRPAPLPRVASLVTLGHLSWLWYAWAAFVLLLLAIVGVQYLRDGTFGDSVWSEIGVGVQRWVIFAAGVTTVPVYAPLLISNGATRRRLSDASMAAMAAVSVIGTAVVLVGYQLERLVYAGADWVQALDDGTPAVSAEALGRALVDTPLAFAASFVAGWIIGVGFYRFGTSAGVALIVPGLIPVLLVDMLLGAGNNPIGGIDVLQERLDDIADIPLAVAAPLALVVVVVACLVARRYTADTDLRN